MIEVTENKELIKEKQDIQRKLDKRDLDNNERLELENRLSELTFSINSIVVQSIDDERARVKDIDLSQPIKNVTQARKLLKEKRDKYIVLTRRVREIEKQLIDTKKNGLLLLDGLKRVYQKEKNNEPYNELDKEVFRLILEY